MSNPNNISANPRFSILSYAQQNSPRGDFLFSQQTWTPSSSVPLVFAPPQNVGNGEMFFIKELHLLIQNGTSLGNGKLLVYHADSNPSNLITATSIIDLHNYFDVDPASPLQDPQFPTDPSKVYSKLLLVFHAPIMVRSSTSDAFQVLYVDSVNNVKADGIPSGEIHVSASGWRILEGSF